MEHSSTQYYKKIAREQSHTYVIKQVFIWESSLLAFLLNRLTFIKAFGSIHRCVISLCGKVTEF